MNAGWVRRVCLAFPHATESVQWGDNLVFKVGGKIFAIAPLEPAESWLSFKCSPEEFAEYVECPGIVPAPYLARAHWIALQSQDALTAAEVKRMLRRSYDLVFERLPKKARASLAS